ncbi:MAG: hypothetical protein AABZ34_05510 [Nitrospirota bacterium]
MLKKTIIIAALLIGALLAYAATKLKLESEAEGLRLTRHVWSDMKHFGGYLSHQILVDEDAPGHVMAIAKW